MCVHQGQKQADWRKKREEFIATLRAAKEVHHRKNNHNPHHHHYHQYHRYFESSKRLPPLSPLPLSDSARIRQNPPESRSQSLSPLCDSLQAQRYVKAGGNLKDLPPPPPMDTSDYIQCPHCERRSIMMMICF